MANFGYVRISDASQNVNRQLDTMSELGLKDEQIFIDKQSGKDFQRPAYQELLSKLQEGDVLYISELSRFGRNYDEILNQWKHITKEIKADIIVCDMPLLNTTIHKDVLGTFISDVILQVLGLSSHIERDWIRKRQAEGIASAKKRGVKFGRSPIKSPENFAEIVNSWRNKEITFAEALGQSRLKKSTFYNRLRELKIKKKSKKV